MDIEAEAERLYSAIPIAKPTWQQLGDITKSVWRERALAQHQPPALPEAPGEQASCQLPNQDEQIGLF